VRVRVDFWPVKLKSQIEGLHPKSEPVPHCYMSDRHGTIQIHENQESAKNRRSMALGRGGAGLKLQVHDEPDLRQTRHPAVSPATRKLNPQD
jgi:hypothetical protein